VESRSTLGRVAEQAGAGLGRGVKGLSTRCIREGMVIMPRDEFEHLLEAFNAAKHTAWQTVVKIITTGFVLAPPTCAVIKFKLFGGSP